MPVRAELQSVIKRDILLRGKVTFHERGLHYQDARIGLFVCPYASVRKLTVHMDNAGVEDWLQVSMNQFEGKNMVPAGLVAEESFYLNLKNIDKVFNGIKTLFAEMKKAD